MPESKLKVYVKARFDVIWEKLLDKIYHPEKYVDRIKNVDILEDAPDHVLRLIHFNDSTWQELKELIVHDKSTGIIVYRLVDHPYFEGETVNICGATNEIYHLELDYEINWKLKNSANHESNEQKDISQKALQIAIQQMKVVSEEAEAVYRQN
ncbi:unnamed protein product [Adineta ricciae]|uniref:Uncharacterized protein n=1 Tax=Adineta ricciae TaxID=249248 RepID=A0A813ZHC7_ADIRI|nr:unnamed protein product [Adineta ricciae]CAF1640173.1 unnamed protein product [Adineta ricciae]